MPWYVIKFDWPWRGPVEHMLQIARQKCSTGPGGGWSNFIQFLRLLSRGPGVAARGYPTKTKCSTGPCQGWSHAFDAVFAKCVRPALAKACRNL